MKIEFDDQKLKVLEVLISAAGKSPATDTHMMLLAVDMLRYLAGQVEAANTKPAPSTVNGLSREATDAVHDTIGKDAPF